MWELRFTQEQFGNGMEVQQVGKISEINFSY